MRLCNKIIGLGPEIGEAQAADSRMCLKSINIGPEIGESGPIIIYGAAGAIVYGAAGKIRYQ